MPSRIYCRKFHGKFKHKTQHQSQCKPRLAGVLCALLFFCLVLPAPLAAQTTTPVVSPATPQTAETPTAQPDPAQLAQQAIQAYVTAVFEAMSPADRVGQLFVITFEGNQITADSDIVELIHQERIGGVVLSPEKHNFANTKGEQTPLTVARLANQLQALTYGYLVTPEQALTLPLTSSLPFSDSVALASNSISPAIPLLIGVEQLGDGFPTTALRREFTPLPSQMALGATWNPALVQAVGKIVGQELHGVGVNLLLGPNLDVVDAPRTDPVGALGLYSFGGDPYWVSQMGRAYIAGVHEGSANGVATIAGHFPGQGSIDRFPEQEVATVQKSITELRRLALPPFSSVTRQPSSVLSFAGDPAATDGLMTSHMRFSALQGVTPGRTTPISLMPDLRMVLNNEGLDGWYAGGGIMMTNGLGIPAIRRYYDATLQSFPYKRVALDAFVAGHDLLYLSHLSPDGSWNTEKRYIEEILQFFRDRYESDPDFHAQVDSAVYRILRLKFGLYQAPMDLQGGAQLALPTEDIQMLAPPAQVLRQLSDVAIFDAESVHRTEAATVIGQVTRAAITLLYPDVQNLSDVIDTPPQADDQLLIFSDSRLFSECEGCIAETALGPEELKEIITRLYGSAPGGTGQIDPERVYGRSFVELATLLDTLEVTANQRLTATLSVTGMLPNGPVAETTLVPNAINDALSDNGNTQPEELLTANERLQRLISDANWIIFAMLDVDPTNQNGSDVVKRFLRQQSEPLGNKQVIVLALNAPYFLDATEISKLTAYFGVYSKTQPFLEGATRALFRGYTPPGVPPVSVPGTRFNNLAEQLQPNPLNPLQVTVYVDETPLPVLDTATTPDLVIQVGAPVRLEINQILDHNGHPVPDGIEVEFALAYEGRDITIPVDVVLTRNGSAMTRNLTIEQPGRLLISASVGGAKTVETLAIQVQAPAAAVAGNVLVTTTAETLNGESVTATAPITLESPITLTGEGGTPLISSTEPPRGVNIDTLVIAFLTILVTLSLLIILQSRILPRSMLMNNLLWATICGLGAYILYGLGLLPGIEFLQTTLRFWGTAVVVFIGMLLPLLWLQLRAE